jgi:hypothetical protein
MLTVYSYYLVPNKASYRIWILFVRINNQLLGFCILLFVYQGNTKNIYFSWFCYVFIFQWYIYFLRSDPWYCFLMEDQSYNDI